MSLEKQVAIVTGSSTGIGRGVAIALAACGAAVAVNYPTAQDEGDANEVCETISQAGGQAIPVRGDVSDEVDVARMIEKTDSTLGDINILVNNAGIATASPVHEMPVAQWDRLIAVHVRGTFLMTRAVLPGMYERGYGRIINTASQLAYKGAPGFAHYTASKGAIIAFTRSLALEAGNSGVTVNCVAPGATQTRMLADVPPDILEEIRLAIPLGRLAEVEDIVPSYVFLAGAGGAHYQGQCISPNGGDVFL